MGGEEELNDFANYLANVEELKHEKGMGDSIMELKSLIQTQRINRNSASKNRNKRAISGQNSKMLIYGKEKKSETDIKLENKESSE